jgi:hypothetical protein
VEEKMSDVVLAVEKSQNSKTGVVSSTYAPIHSCPKTCPFMDNGCYGQSDFCGLHLNRINKEAVKQGVTKPLQIAKIEAAGIRKLSGKRPLRLHVVGDCSTPMSAEVVTAAAEEYKAKDNQDVWTYTHAWRTVPRSKWGSVSVLASCETIEDAKLAIRRGYAVSMVRAKSFNKVIKVDGLKLVPCPNITHNTPCDRCKLCMKDQKLRDTNRVICFFPHGKKAQEAKNALFTEVYVPRN